MRNGRKIFLIYFIVMCMVASSACFFTECQVQATAIEEYVMGGADFDDNFNVTAKYYLKTKNKKLIVNGTIDYSCGTTNKKLKSKKRTFKIASNCKYVCTGYNYSNKSTSYTGNDYKIFKKLCKYWMDGKGDKKTGTYNSIWFKMKNGKIFEIVMAWDPYEGG